MTGIYPSWWWTVDGPLSVRWKVFINDTGLDFKSLVYRWFIVVWSGNYSPSRLTTRFEQPTIQTSVALLDYHRTSSNKDFKDTIRGLPIFLHD